MAISAAKQLTSGELDTLVYLYQRSGTTWTLQHSIRPDDASSASYFGLNIALDGNTLAVRAINLTDINTGQSVYAFTLSGGSWQQQAKWQPGANNTSSASAFGGQLAVDNGVIVIGDTGLGDQRKGAVHLMMPTGGT